MGAGGPGRFVGGEADDADADGGHGWLFLGLVC